MAPKRKRKSVILRLFRWLIYVFVFLNVLFGLAYATALINKDKLLEVINTNLKTVINGDVHIGDLNFTILEKFPAWSISLSDVYIRGQHYEKYHHDFFKAERIYVDIRPGQLILGTISLESIKIENGNVFVFRAKDGYTNSDIIKKKETKDTVTTAGFKPTIALRLIQFENTQCTYFDSIKRKSYGILLSKTDLIFSRTDSSRQLSIQGDIKFSGLMLNELKGSYLADKQARAKLNIEVIPGVKGMKLLPSELQFDQSKVELSGIFDFAPPGSFTLNIHSPNLSYQEGLTLVTKALSEKLGKFSLTQPIDFEAKIKGSLAQGEPEIDMQFHTQNSDFKSGKIAIGNFTFAGTFMNHLEAKHPNGDPNSRLTLDKFSGHIKGIPTNGQLSITNLKNPLLSLGSHGAFQLKELNHQSDTTRVKFTSGLLKVDINFDGYLMEYLDSTRTSYNGKLVGSIDVDNGGWMLPEFQKNFEQVDVALRFNNQRMDIEKINLRINGNPVETKGSITGFIPFFLQPEKKGYVNLSIYSPRLDLAPLVKKKPKRGNTKSVKGKKKVSDMIDLLYEKVEFELDLKVDNLMKDAFKATQVEAKLKLLKNQLVAGPVKMNTSGGSLSLLLSMNDLDKADNKVILQADVKNADIKSLFRSFENFGMKKLTSSHLSGKVSTQIKLRTTIDDQFRIKLATLRGNVNFRIRQGKIVNFEPLQNMSNFLFKKRDFTDVDFAEIKGGVQLNGTSMKIRRMEIESSVLFLFIEGVYSITGNNTDLSIQVPLKNLKKRDKDYKPQNVGTDAKVGPSVFLRVRNDKDGKLDFSYDPFKKLRKK